MTTGNVQIAVSKEVKITHLQAPMSVILLSFALRGVKILMDKAINSISNKKVNKKCVIEPPKAFRSEYISNPTANTNVSFTSIAVIFLTNNKVVAFI